MPRQRKHPRAPVGREARGQHPRAQRHPCTEATGPRAGAPWPACCSRPLPTLHPRGPGRRATISTRDALSTPRPRGPGRRSSVSTGETVPTPHPHEADRCATVCTEAPPLDGSTIPGAGRGMQPSRGRARGQRRTARQRERPPSVVTGSPPPCTAATGSRSGAPRPAFHPRGAGRCAAVCTGAPPLAAGSTGAAPPALHSTVFERFDRAVPTWTGRALRSSQKAQRTTMAHSRLHRRAPRSVRPRGGARSGGRSDRATQGGPPGRARQR